MDTPVKYPINLTCLDHRQVKLLALYLELKMVAESGLIPKGLINSSNRFRYYRERLIDLKIIKLERSGNYYLLRGYSAFWKILGIKKTMSKNGRYEKVFCKRIEGISTRKEIMEVLFQHAYDTLKKQKKWENVRNAGRRLNKRNRNQTIEAPLSSSLVAKHLGYKHPCTGREKRMKYFKVKEEPLIKEFVYLPEVNPYRLVPRFRCKKVII